ncbi:hypothetical protein ACFE33_09950 [Falsihalocynthiibacter sp. SS001]|uniref:hypothetical protein n=1 Tax=Falsihalocynthiibacter sp. SS001 TaxID=3349698 RepID=UPI0036D39729
MTDQQSENTRLIEADAKSNKFSIYTAPWGYGVRMREQVGFGARLAQALAGGTALVCVGLAVGMWVLPGSATSEDMAIFKLAFTGVLMLVGILALWFASLGTTYELQVDRGRREVREVLRNKRSQLFVMRRYDFSDISSVVFARDPKKSRSGYASLMLRHTTQTHSIDLVHDKQERLEALRNVLAEDILSETAGAKVAPRRHVRTRSASREEGLAVAGE